MANYPAYEDVKSIGIIGTGTIGASWASYFLSRGYDVTAWDPADGWQDKLGAFVENALPQLDAVGTSNGARGKLTKVATPEEVAGATQFIQENAPERLNIKHELYARIDGALVENENAIFATSTSGLMMTDLAVNCRSANRMVVGHPFNPPHLIPLVEVVAGEKTDPEVKSWAHGFYNHIGKHAIYVNKEVPGHLANRLQAALWREAFLAVKNGIATVEDVNAAIAQGPGLRLALMGPLMIFSLTSGRAGIGASLDHFGPPMLSWLETMTEQPELTAELRQALVDGIDEEMRGRTAEEMESLRDERLVKLLDMLRATERS